MNTTKKRNRVEVHVDGLIVEVMIDQDGHVSDVDHKDHQWAIGLPWSDVKRTYHESGGLVYPG